MDNQKSDKDRGKTQTESNNKKSELYQFEFDENEYDSEVSTDLDSDNLVFSDSSDDECLLIKDLKNEEERIKKNLRLKMNMSLSETKLFYRLVPSLNNVKEIKSSSTSSTLIDEFKRSGLETFNCELLNSAADLNSKYIVESLSKSHHDYKIIAGISNAVESSILLSQLMISKAISAVSLIPSVNSITRDYHTNNGKFRLSNIHRVVPNRNDALQRASSNRLLFHGTQCYSVINILNQGFIPSTNGRYGKGVYLTNGIATALGYAFSPEIKSFYVFVVEVLHSDQLVIEDTPKGNHNFTKFPQCSQLTEEEFVYDSTNSRICSGLNNASTGNVPQPISNQQLADIFVANQDIAVPAYLLQFDLTSDKV